MRSGDGFQMALRLRYVLEGNSATIFHVDEFVPAAGFVSPDYRNLFVETKQLTEC
jgi:hypothetical protein